MDSFKGNNGLKPLKDDDLHFERWQMIVLVSTAGMRWLYELVEEDNLSAFCKTRDQLKALGKFMAAFGKLRRVATGVDGYVFKVLMGEMDEGNPRYWQMAAEFCKLRLLGVAEAQARKRVKSWNVQADFTECERVGKSLLKDARLMKKVEAVKVAHGVCRGWVEKLQGLMGCEDF